MLNTDRSAAASQQVSGNLNADSVKSTDAAFDRWLVTHTFFRPPASQLPEELQRELRGQFLADHIWNLRPRCHACNQYIERRSADRRQVTMEDPTRQERRIAVTRRQ